MTEIKLHEVAISFVCEQRAVAETLTRELQRQGLAVFCDDFETVELASRIADEDLHAGLERAVLVVLLFSRQYLDRAWERDERGLILCEIAKQSGAVVTLRFDDTSVPDGLPWGTDCRSADDYAFMKMAEDISVERSGRLAKGVGTATTRDPHLTSLTGEAVWLDYDHGGQLVIGRNEMKFETRWSKCNATSVHACNDAPSIEGVALASGYTSINQIIDARFLDYGGRTRTPREGEIVVFRNVSGHYAAVQVVDVKDATREDDIDELRLRYVVQPDGSDDFGGGACVDSVRVRGFRSLRNVELCDLGHLVAMIGPNGCGKSNVIRLFEMMQRMLGPRRLADFVGEHGGGDDQLFDGSKTTPRVEVEVVLRVGLADYYEYRFSLKYGSNDRLLLADEAYRLRDGEHESANWQPIESSTGGVEAGLVAVGHRSNPATIHWRVAGNIVRLLGDCRVYQFHDTSRDSGFKKPCDLASHQRLATDGHNLAAVLLHLEREDRPRYELICKHIGRVLPGFDRFDLQEIQGRVALRWTSRNGGKTLGAHLTSDGSLRLFALVTLLNLPSEILPTVVLLDEPELGLHPAGIALVGGMVKSLSYKRQIMVATQSPLLIDAFDLDEVVVMGTDNKGTRAYALASDDYKEWLEDGYLPSELWQRNVLGGRP